ncbi:MAG: hypothetical protein ACTS2F_06250 [Thainema sp.]
MSSAASSQESSHSTDSRLSARQTLWQSVGLYRRQVRICLRQSLQASAWLLLPMLVGLAGLRAYQQMDEIALWPWLVGIVVGFVGIAGYCIGSGQLSRWAWLYLQPKLAVDVASSTELPPVPADSAPKQAGLGKLSWRKRIEFGLLALKLSGVSAGVLMLAYSGLSLLVTALYFILTLSTGLAAIAAVQFPPATVQHTAVMAIVLILLLFTVGTVWISLRFLLHFFLAEAILVIKPIATAGSSLRQSWRLTRRSTRLLLRLAALIWLLTVPLQVPAQFVSWLLIVKLGQGLIPEPSHWLLQWLAVSIGCWLVGWLSLPLWQIAKAYLYQHWRNHQKLQDLQAEQQWWQA